MKNHQEQNKYLVYSIPTYGSFKYMLEKNNLTSSIVIALNDDLSYGPISNSEERLDYFQNVMNTIAPDDKQLKDYVKSCVNEDFKNQDFNNCKIVIIHSSNISEQLMLMKIVKEFKNNEIYEIPIDNKTLNIKSTAELAPEDLYKLIGTEEKILNDRKNKLIQEWNNLLVENKPIRILKNNTILSEEEDYYDNDIIIHCSKDYTNIFKIIGNILGNNDQLLSDSWIHYRIIKLIEQKKLLSQKDDNHPNLLKIRLS